MTRYLIDTNWVVDALHGHEPEAATLQDLAPHGIAISLITYGELYEGAYYARDREEAITGLNELMQATTILPLTPAIMERFAVLRGSLPRPVRQQVGDLDLLIAATALFHGLALVTNNLRDFMLIPDLALYEAS